MDDVMIEGGGVNLCGGSGRITGWSWPATSMTAAIATPNVASTSSYGPAPPCAGNWKIIKSRFSFKGDQKNSIRLQPAFRISAGATGRLKESAIMISDWAAATPRLAAASGT